jgi:hypothetical protein
VLPAGLRKSVPEGDAAPANLLRARPSVPGISSLSILARFAPNTIDLNQLRARAGAIRVVDDQLRAPERDAPDRLDPVDVKTGRRKVRMQMVAKPP